MLEDIRYTNHLGETIRLDGSEGIYSRHNELRNYTWSFESENRRISKIYRQDVVDKKLPILILGDLSIRDRLFKIVEADTVTGIPGKLWINDYYLSCFVTGSVKPAKYMPDRIQMELTITTDNPVWIKERTKSFRLAEQTVGLKYDKKYNYRYTDYAVNVTITNESLADAPFILTIYGACENPEILIGNQRYKIYAELTPQEYITLTAIAPTKTIVLTDAYGTGTNIFNSREKSVDVFKPIPSGTFDVVWDGDFAFDLTLLDERSAPPWS
ncbi:MAG: hypothetical protein II685_02060 [Clostridia bacterium]|nr:hypothetical protein [Clostridia bacterium]